MEVSSMTSPSPTNMAIINTELADRATPMLLASPLQNRQSRNQICLHIWVPAFLSATGSSFSPKTERQEAPVTNNSSLRYLRPSAAATDVVATASRGMFISLVAVPKRERDTAVPASSVAPASEAYQMTNG